MGACKCSVVCPCGCVTLWQRLRSAPSYHRFWGTSPCRSPFLQPAITAAVPLTHNHHTCALSTIPAGMALGAIYLQQSFKGSRFQAMAEPLLHKMKQRGGGAQSHVHRGQSIRDAKEGRSIQPPLHTAKQDTKPPLRPWF